MGKIKDILFGTSQKSSTDANEIHIELGDSIIIDSLYDDTYVIIQLEDDVTNVHPIKQAFICENLRPIDKDIINLSDRDEYIAPRMGYANSLCKRIFNSREVNKNDK